MRILLADDHSVVRRGLRELLTEAFADARFDEVATGEDALDLVERHHFDLLVMDVSMPRRGGIETLKELQKRSAQLPVIVLSHHAEDQYAVRALRAGAKAYLTKDCAPEELVRAARKILAGGTYVTESLAERLASSLDVDRDKPLHESLSDRELEVLRLLGGGKAVKEIAAVLSLSEKTVSTYRTRLLDKMQMKSNAELMRYALRTGLVE